MSPVTTLPVRMRAAHPSTLDAQRASAIGFYQQPGLAQVDAEGLRDVTEVDATVERAQSVVARDTARPQLVLLDTSGDEPTEIPENDNHPAMLPWRFPNPGMTSQQLRSLLISDAQIEGNSFLWFELQMDPRGTGRAVPVSAWRMPPESVKVNPGTKPGEYVDNYEFLRYGQGSDEDNPKYKPFEIFHFKTLHPTDPYRGLGIIPRLRHEILIRRYAKRWRENFFKNGVPATLLLEAQNEIRETAKDPNKLTRLSDQLFYGMTGMDGERIGRPIISYGEFKATALPRPSEDEVGWIKTMGWSKGEIGSAFGVPPTKMSDYTGQQLSSNAEQQEHDYWVDTIMGWNRLLLSYLNDRYLRTYFPDEQLEFSWDYSDVLALAPSKTERAEWTSKLAREGLIAGIEARRMNEIPDPGDDIANIDSLYVLRFNGRPLDMFDDGFGEPAEGEPVAAPSDPPPAGNDDEEEPDENTTADTEEEEPTKVFRDAFAKCSLPVKAQTKDISSDLLAGVRLELERHRKRVGALLRRMVALAGQQQVEVDALPAPFNVQDPRALEAVKAQAIRVVEQVNASTVDTLRASIGATLESGAPLGSREVRDSIQRAFRHRRKAWQLDRIARTEAHQARELGSLEAMVQNEVEWHEWLSAADERVRTGEAGRPDHLAMDGQRVRVSERFTDESSGATFAHPGDGSNAEAADVINCRCTTASVFPDEDEEKAFRRRAFGGRPESRNLAGNGTRDAQAIPKAQCRARASGARGIRRAICEGRGDGMRTKRFDGGLVILPDEVETLALNAGDDLKGDVAQLRFLLEEEKPRDPDSRQRRLASDAAIDRRREGLSRERWPTRVRCHHLGR